MTRRTALPSDLDGLLELAAQARRRLQNDGVDQWQNGYPGRGILEEDQKLRQAWVWEQDGVLAAYVCLDTRPEPDYAGIEGRWLSEGPYGTIHRTMVSDACCGRGLSAQLFSLCEALCRAQGFASVRVDTHAENRRMRHIIERQGYTLCGRVTLAGGLPRVGYEKLLAPADVRR